MKQLRFCLVLCSMCAAALAWESVSAQSYPSRQVRILVGTPAAGPVDMLARGTAQVLAPLLGQPVIVENRVGADSMIAGEACAKSAPDGHVLCAIDSLGIALNPVIRKMTFDPYRDLTPVVHYGYIGSAFLVHPSLPVNSMRELLELAKANPETITFGSWGVASGPNLYIEWFKNAKGIVFRNISYKAASQAFPAMLAGEIQVAFYSAGAAAGAVRAGRAKALAVTLSRRSSHLPDVPTWKEAGLDIGLVTSVGLYAPAGTPQGIILRLNREIASGLIHNAEMRAKFITSQGLEVDPPAGGSPEEMAAAMLLEREKWAGVVKAAKLKIE